MDSEDKIVTRPEPIFSFEQLDEETLKILEIDRIATGG